jgi:hypothetical protein
MSNAKGPERVEEMERQLRKWQAIERVSMEQTAKIMEETRNPYVRMIMEVIRHDSLMHHRVQQLLIDSIVYEDIPLSHDDLAAIWKSIEAHDEAEKEVIAIAEGLLETAWQPIHKALLSYLLTDEKKHDEVLEQLNEIKKELARRTQ